MQTQMEMGFREANRNHEELQKDVTLQINQLGGRLTQTEDALRHKLHGSGQPSKSGSSENGFHTDEDDEEDRYQTQMAMRWRKEGHSMYEQEAY